MKISFFKFLIKIHFINCLPKTCLDWELHSETDAKGVSKSAEAYTRTSKSGKVYGAGDAGVLSIKSLFCKEKRTFKDELRTIIASWRSIYGKLPWAELAAKYEQDQSVTASQIEDARRINLKVNVFFTNFEFFYCADQKKI